MKNTTYNEYSHIHYTLQGDYYLPDLKLPAEEQRTVGIWGQRHMRYLKRHRKLLYYNLLTGGKPNGCLYELDKQAEEMFFRLVKQMSEREGLTERLKAEKPIEWVKRMNSFRSAAAETVNAELIFI